MLEEDVKDIMGVLGRPSKHSVLHFACLTVFHSNFF